MSSLKNNFAIVFFAFAALHYTACNAPKDPVENVANKIDSTAKQESENGVWLNKAEYKSVGVIYGKVEIKKLSSTLKVNGTIEVSPENAVSITIPYGGIVRSTSLLEGKHVNKGERLATLANPEFIQLQQDYLDHKSQLEYLKIEYERQQQLAGENINAKKTLQKAKADYQSMLVRVNGLKAKLSLINISLTSLENVSIQNTISIYSPISGSVSKININQGSHVNPNDELFRIINADKPYVALSVFEKDITKLKKGQLVRFSLVNDQKEYSAKVQLIGKEIRADRSIRVICRISDKSSAPFMPGMYIKAIVETESNEVNALPDEAIVNFQGKNFIFLTDQKNGQVSHERYHFIMSEIQTGISEQGFTQVYLPQSFNSSKNSIVIKGAYSLMSKMKNSPEED
jgi:cobalt-zinc-cadmium efflux system membrane fusion protein